MLIKIDTLKDYTLESLDGEIGRAKDFYFDDRYWTIRYLIADTGNWLTGRKVLIAPYALGAANKDTQRITVELTKKQIEESPPLNSETPVSRQFESEFYGYYQWPEYWSGPHMWGANPSLMRVNYQPKPDASITEKWDPNLRSTSAVSGYHIQAKDGAIGHVEDFIIDDETWAIRYLIINTSNWWIGKKILVSPRWIKSVDWDTSEVSVDLPREVIKQAPEYTDWSILTREFEDCLHKHYKHKGYWIATGSKPKDGSGQGKGKG